MKRKLSDASLQTLMETMHSLPESLIAELDTQPAESFDWTQLEATNPQPWETASQHSVKEAQKHSISRTVTYIGATAACLVLVGGIGLLLHAGAPEPQQLPAQSAESERDSSSEAAAANSTHSTVPPVQSTESKRDSSSEAAANGTHSTVPPTQSVLYASVAEISGDTLFVKPVDGSWELKSSDRFTLPAAYLGEKPQVNIDTMLKIVYDGDILETYPAQFGHVYCATVLAQDDPFVIHWPNSAVTTTDTTPSSAVTTTSSTTTSSVTTTPPVTTTGICSVGFDPNYTGTFSVSTATTNHSTTTTVSAEHTVYASVIEISGGTLFVKPIYGSWELKSSDRFTLPASCLGENAQVEIGTMLEIVYNGYILESYPAQFDHVYRVTVTEHRLSLPLVEQIIAESSSFEEILARISAIVPLKDVGSGFTILEYQLSDYEKIQLRVECEDVTYYSYYWRELSSPQEFPYYRILYGD